MTWVIATWLFFGVCAATALWWQLDGIRVELAKMNERNRE